MRNLPFGIEAAEWSQIAPGLQDALVNAINNREWPVTIFGGKGTGKTYAAAYLFSRWKQYGSQPVVWWSAHEVVGMICECRQNGRGYLEITRLNGDRVEFWPRSFLASVSQAAIVVLDDIGTREMTDPQRQALNEIIDARVGRPMICTTNHKPEKLAKMTDDRIVSRLLAGRMIEVNGKDRRPVKSVIQVGSC